MDNVHVLSLYNGHTVVQQSDTTYILLQVYTLSFSCSRDLSIAGHVHASLISRPVPGSYKTWTGFWTGMESGIFAHAH